MKLKEFNPKTARLLRDLVAYKWLKVDKAASTSTIILPPTMHDGDGMDRMGNKYVCEALAVGPNVRNIKPGDKFLLHEYDKVDQGTKWQAEDVMFAEEKTINIMLDKDSDPFMIPAKHITEKMIEEYEDY